MILSYKCITNNYANEFRKTHKLGSTGEGETDVQQMKLQRNRKSGNKNHQGPRGLQLSLVSSGSAAVTYSETHKKTQRNLPSYFVRANQ